MALQCGVGGSPIRCCREIANFSRGCDTGSAHSPDFWQRLEGVKQASRLALLLDYDGTLVPIAATPELAVPDLALISLLGRLAARPGTSVHLVSGRPTVTLSEWFGHLPLALWAEHGAYHRPVSDAPWAPTGSIRTEWIDEVYAVVAAITSETAGSMIERKSVSLAWHYRGVEPERAGVQAHELRVRLRPLLRTHALEVLEGRQVIEVRMAGVSKAVVADRLPLDDSRAILAFGDDWTDEDLFEALPESSVTVAVGRRRSSADYQLPDEAAVRAALEALLA